MIPFFITKSLNLFKREPKPANPSKDYEFRNHLMKRHIRNSVMSYEDTVYHSRMCSKYECKYPIKYQGSTKSFYTPIPLDLNHNHRATCQPYVEYETLSGYIIVCQHNKRIS